ncbi:hypothetical protein GHT06_020688 [Daphnia sinensis]|uniref:Membrane glycoprotein lig-1 n=1 Tax=Daphnia sinensis TaxID=1820382 RepID=A0AAD5PPC0_9CRUS|nr:hypothetical protein GHT06_020688 [Daphnia sinensis]
MQSVAYLLTSATGTGLLVFSSCISFITVTLTVNAQNPTCPTGGPAANCNCRVESPGFSIECDGSYADPEEVREYLIFHQSYGLIVSLAVNNIAQSKFSYVPDDFLVGNQVPSVSFKCSHGFSVNQGILVFSVRAFTDSFNECGLTGDLTFSNCNLRQFDAAVLNNCKRLNKLAFMDSHVESLIDIPSLTNFTVYSPRQWAGANQRGLSRMTLAPGASLPLLTYLDLTGNSLDDDSINFVADETVIEEMHLEGNNFAFVPNLTSAFNLHTFSIALNVSSSTPILLPNPRAQSRSLNASFYSSLKIKNEVTVLDGMFGQDAVNLKLNMTEFKEDVFFEPLSQSPGLVVYCALAVGAQSPSCPDTNPTSYCSCYPEGPGFRVECEGDYATAEKMREALTFYQSYLKHLAFVDSHVESLIDFPTLTNLQNLTVYSPRQWTAAPQRGLSRMALAPGASLPLLSYLDLTGNSLEDDSVKFVSQEISVQEMHLEGNHFSSVPSLTNCLNLHTFSTTLDISSSVSIQLPNPRDQLQPLKASFYPSSSTVHEVTSLEGMFGNDILNLKLDMTRFDESVFLGPLQSSNLIISLNPDSKFLYGCNIAWLVRDNRQLLTRVRNGFCADGTAFESIPEQELSGSAINSFSSYYRTNTEIVFPCLF